jgi:large subunit ribosomal protein L10
MALSLEQKKAMVQEVADVAGKALSAVAAEYRGLTATEMESLRVEARKQGVFLKVVKNTLARRAVEGTSFECLKDAFVGPLVLAFSIDDPGAAARVFKDFVKEHKKLQVSFLGVGGQLLPASDLDRLASLPTREQALSMLMATMRAPVQKLAATLNGVPSKLVRTLAAIKDAKAGGGVLSELCRKIVP